MQDLKRKKVLNLLEKIEPVDQQESFDIQKVKELIVKHENIFDRDCLVAHLTASALVVNPRTKKVLLHNHKKLNKWLQFGGHADGESDLAKVALKEAGEETGLIDLVFLTHLPIDLEVQKIPFHKGIPEHLHLDFRFVLITDAEKVPTPDEVESQELQFFDFSAISQMNLDLALVRLANKAEKLISKG
ncbi:MAG: NUDIX hydrolase [Candidatus Pacebacteria bacterium CG10_big_fil_rev_8_21_14_0_10_36_11]|nr:NUDIX hydrolase [Candidatus Pacearchaeota archaeon]OIP74037.1 MAG: hypothetical protein AUK08_02155 [Candidatus Pacebacteria bacterium CG2_30_36_39]PIR64321.1 MAG: NUDIX hydrolase [Candidatus Pacebacteria bacterium CG10_big_fil_rev_8_21_14_0_10_36_11]PJC43219.1 MAG: NUDIX hydrolase [Candidatus Pacebacteria bacterium CG_4_9_14_0_2_um_filter_36_8]